MGGPAHWDPDQYGRFADERGRPFIELVARIRVEEPRRVVDLGCGPGSLTRLLSERWPQALVTGVDNSPDMMAAAAAEGRPGHLEFEAADIRDWRPPGPVDVIVANAAFQWVPGHRSMLAGMAGWLAPGGALAFQVPDNFDEPSHTIVADLRRSPRWRARLADGADRGAGVERPESYLAALAGAGLEPDVWQTRYLHVLPGDDAVLQWIKGTALRPVLTALAGDPTATADFLAECGAALRVAYPPSPYGTRFPFRRTFAVGHAVSAASS